MIERLVRFAPIGRYALASVGPVGSALAQFALSLVLLRRLEPQAFGQFSFLLVAAQFSGGVWSALFCAPLPTLIAHLTEKPRQALLRRLLAANLLAAGLALLVFLGMSLAMRLQWLAASLFAAYAALALLRTFARAQAYATGALYRVMASDMIYSATLLVGVLVVFWFPAYPLEPAFATLLAGALLGLLAFGSDYLKEQFLQFPTDTLSAYWPVWRQHSSWSLLGVVTTEATANAHVYIVTLFSGATAFAPLAASALLIRPINVAMNALTDLERAQMARQIGQAHIGQARASVRFFRWALLATWVATACAIVALFAYDARLIFPQKYELDVLRAGAVLWMGVALVRSLRAPDGVLLQAAGEFRSLAFASVFSSVGSVLAVAALLAWGGPLWSIAGVMVGEMLMAWWTWRQARRWLARATTEGQMARPPQTP